MFYVKSLILRLLCGKGDKGPDVDLIGPLGVIYKILPYPAAGGCRALGVIYQTIDGLTSQPSGDKEGQYIRLHVNEIKGEQGGIKCANRRTGFIDSEGSHR